MRIKALLPLTPKSELAAEIISPPYDVISEDEAREILAKKPRSFVKVIRPEINFPEDSDAYESKIYQSARKALLEMQRLGELEKNDQESYFVYQLSNASHIQTGIVCLFNASDYRDNLIKKHEKTRPQKENERVRLTLALRAHSGLVYLAYRRKDEIDQHCQKTIEFQPPKYQITDEYQNVHTIWQIPANDEFNELLQSIDTCYIADGHHRAAAAARVAEELHSEISDPRRFSAHNWFPAVMFPHDQLQILPYNRVVENVAISRQDFIKELRARSIKVTQVDESKVEAANKKGKVALRASSDWYLLEFPKKIPKNEKQSVIENLSYSRLQDEVLEPILQIKNPRTDPNISFIGGIHGLHALKIKADNSKAFAFAMPAVDIKDIMAIADADEIMPPKSTWFEPKLKSGFFVNQF